MNKALVREHAATGIPQEKCGQKAAAYECAVQEGRHEAYRLKTEKQDRPTRICSAKQYVENPRGPAERDQAGPVGVWSEQAWRLPATQAKVCATGSVDFLFRVENRITVK